jgi:hypothetical protein
MSEIVDVRKKLQELRTALIKAQKINNQEDEKHIRSAMADIKAQQKKQVSTEEPVQDIPYPTEKPPVLCTRPDVETPVSVGAPPRDSTHPEVG